MQFVQLQRYADAFKSAGIDLVALTYDSPAEQQSFVEDNGIGYPFLSDIDAASVKALGILDAKYEPGTSDYGTPYPGIFVVDKHGVIVGKLFVDGQRRRGGAGAGLAYAKGLLSP